MYVGECVVFVGELGFGKLVIVCSLVGLNGLCVVIDVV